MIVYWHDNVVCLSVCLTVSLFVHLSVSLSIVTKRFLQQKRLNKKCPNSNTILQHSTPYNDS